MNQLVNPDSAFMRLITKIVLSVYLNILWFICSIPIFTIGASTTALFYSCQKIVRDEEGHITQTFFRAFKENFKQGTIIGLIMLVLGALLGADGYILIHKVFTNTFWTMLTAIFIVATIAYLVILMYIFQLNARFENTVKAMFLNSLIVGMRFLLCTVLMFMIYAAMAILVIFIFTPAVIFGFGTCALLCTFVMNGILLQLEGTAESIEDDVQESDLGGNE